MISSEEPDGGDRGYLTLRDWIFNMLTHVDLVLNTRRTQFKLHDFLLVGLLLATTLLLLD